MSSDNENLAKIFIIAMPVMYIIGALNAIGVYKLVEDKDVAIFMIMVIVPLAFLAAIPLGYYCTKRYDTERYRPNHMIPNEYLENNRQVVYQPIHQQHSNESDNITSDSSHTETSSIE